MGSPSLQHKFRAFTLSILILKVNAKFIKINFNISQIDQ
jgi:hypothetical protein